MSKKTAGCLVFLLLSIGAKAQTVTPVRYDNFSFVTNQVQAVGIFTTVLSPSPQAQVTVCAHPANGVPCTNTVQTYTDITGSTKCPLTAQLTPYNASACMGTADLKGNFGFWIPPGTYDYTVCPQGQFACLGPYPISVSSVTGGGGGGGTFGTTVTTSVQSTINSIQASGTGSPVIIPQGFTGSQNFTNPTFLPMLNLTPSPNGDYDKNGVQPVDIFGVRHDGKAVNCNVVGGNTQVSCNTTSFTSADVGKLVILYGAGPSSATHGGVVGGSAITASGGSGGTNGLQPIISTNGGCAYPMRGVVTVAGGTTSNTAVGVWQPAYGCSSLPTTATVATVTGTVTLSGAAYLNVDLPTTIASVVNGSTITVSDVPTVTVNGESIIYGTDDSAALTAACNGHGLAQNGGHYTHTGISLISKGVICDGNNTWIQGAGWAPLANSGGGSNIVYAGKNGSGTDGIWISSEGWGAKLTDMGLRGNSWAHPRGLVISEGRTPNGNGNSAAGEYDHLWIGWMWGDGVGINSGGNQIGEAIFADVATGNGDFNNFNDIRIAGAVHGIDGNNDQATNWTFNGNLQIEESYTGICAFSGININLYYTEFNDTDIQLGPCVSGSGIVLLDIKNYGGESSARNIVKGAGLGAQDNIVNLTIHSGGVGQPPQYEDPSNIMIDLSSPINGGNIVLGDGLTSGTFGGGNFVFGSTTGGERTALMQMPRTYGGSFKPNLVINGSNVAQLSAYNFFVGDDCGTVCGNRAGQPFMLNGIKTFMDPTDYLANPVPWQQNDNMGTLRTFGSAVVRSAKPPGQTDTVANPVYGLTISTVGTAGSTTYNYQLTCTDQSGNETSPAPTTAGGTTPYTLTINTGNATLSTSNYITIGQAWNMRGCAQYNLYGDNGIGGVLGFLVSTPSYLYGTAGIVFNDQGQYTKVTTRVPPTSTQSGRLTVDGWCDGCELGVINAPKYCTLQGYLDETCINNALAALPSTGGVIKLGPGVYNLANTVIINKPVLLLGNGAATNCTQTGCSTLNPPYLPATELHWIGSTGSNMIHIVPSGSNVAIGRVNLKNLSIDGASTTGVNGVDANCLQYSQWESVSIDHVPGIGLVLGCTTGSNAMLNTFTQLEMNLVGTGLVLDGPADSVCSTTCGDSFNNTFVRTHIVYTNVAGVDIKSADNNQFIDLNTYRNTGSGPGINFEAPTGSGTSARVGGTYTYIYHYQPPPTNGVTFSSGGNVIHDYDIANGQATPTWSGSHNQVYVTNGAHTTLITDPAGISLADSTSAAPTPTKTLTVSNGHFQVLANDFATVLLDIDDSGNTKIANGTNIVYRCATAGATLPVGSLTINAAACGTTTDTGLRVK